MAIDPSSELSQFHQFVGAQLKQGSDLSPEEAIDLWRAENPLEAGDDLVAAIEEALEDMRNGDRGIPHDEFMKDLRRRYGSGA
jgi:hypothetical protein